MLRVMYSRDYKPTVTVNDIHSLGGYLAVWQVRENQRKDSPSWSSVMDKSGYCKENIIYFFTWSLIITSKKMYYIFILSVTAKILVQV